ncbi:TonB-dependent hemoglobin/transferrin/lactoferrin family receptor [Salinisphaera sp. G21_0]|uniref:TonB-dependent hemoglobin/transferrin/lactoferrin family receptor n=1 Tax=Salinisphaera sp. G21_0 TaxID=2821094 RepID=UPI001ADBBF27|nr:TonB-dependent hemoglobin/transferrin/lactoferrin family receptor [Salinisphaera sp. G21_0]MBO9484086.1 TonB-dependent hemoglobin/transferrin/lactoferrin family receptor [Salinisphaera sp. G21_0]
MKFSKNTLALAVMAATVSLAQTAPVLAETASESTDKNYQPTLMNQVTVTATRSEKQLKDVSGAVTVIDSEQLENDIVQNIRDMVRYEPGVQVISGRGGPDSFTIRGMGGNRVKITVDGVNQAQQLDAGGDFLRSQRNFVDVETLKAVEIVKGPASSLYGSDAIGGMVAFQTKDPSDLLARGGDDSYAGVKAGYSSANEGFTETLSLANRTGKLETMAIYTRRDHKQMDTHSGADVDGNNRGQANPSETGLNNLLTKAKYQINDSHRVGLTGEIFQSKTDVELKTLNPSTTKGKDENTRYRIGFEHQWDAGLALFDSLDWQINWQQSKSTMITDRPAYVFPGMDPFPHREMDYNYEERAILAGAQFNKNLLLADLEHNLIYGFNASYTKVDNSNTEHNLETGVTQAKDYMPKTAATKLGLFIQDDVQMTDRLNLTAGVRYDKYKFDPDGMMGSTANPKPAYSSDGSKVTGRLGTVYDLTNDLALFAQFSQGFKAPAYTDMYYAYGMGVIVEANPDLKPEESNSFELGLRGEHQLGSYEVTGFLNKYKNFIEQDMIGKDPVTGKDIYQNRNIGKTDIKGIELRSELWLDVAINAPEGTTLRSSVAWAEGKNKSDDEYLNTVAPLSAVIGLGYDAPSALWGGELTWTLVKGKSDAKVTNVDQGTAKEKEQFNPSGYGTVDLTTYYQPSDNLTLRAGMFNITDKKYWHLNDVRGRATDYAGLDRFAQPGRNFSVSVQWDI